MPIVIAAAVVAAGTYAAAKSQKAPKQAGAVDIGQTTADAIQANITNAPEAEALARRTNAFNQNQQLSLLNQAIPGYTKWANSLSSSAQAQAEGKISDEQASNLTRLAAERGINVGSRGQANQYSLLRDFGINQFQGQQQSMGIMQLLAGMSRINPMSPQSMYATPGQALGAAQQQQQMDQSYLNAQNAYENQQRAAPWQALAAGAGTFAAGYGGMAGGAGAGAGAAKGFTGAGSTSYGGGQTYLGSQPFMQPTNYSQAPSYSPSYFSQMYGKS